MSQASIAQLVEHLPTWFVSNTHFGTFFSGDIHGVTLSLCIP